MSRFMRFSTALLIILLAIVPARAGAERDILKTTLSSGLTVILEEDHSAPVAAFQMWVRVGSADENEAEAGIAHVFEHMLFKGTEKRGVGDLAKAVDSAGGSINAYTSYDNTVYHLAVASRFFSTGLDILSDAIQNSAFDPVELKKELEVVVEEIRRGEDNPGRILNKKLMKTSYTTHPYKRGVIGSRETVRGLTRDYIIGFFNKWYVPNNMTLVVVGDFDKAKALAEIKRSFKGFKKKADPHTPRPVEPRQDGPRSFVISEEITESHMTLAYHIPELKHPDTYALDVTASILAQGAGSRLYKRLKKQNDLVHSVSGYAMTPLEPGAFFISATLEAEKIAETVEAIIEEIERLAIEGADEDELERAKMGLESSFVYSRESMQGKASQLGYYETIARDLKFESKYIAGIRKVSAGDVSRVLNTYLRSNLMTFGALVPEEVMASVSGERIVELAKRSEATARKKYAKAPAVTDDITRVKLDNGITLIVKEDHSNETVAMYAAFPGGLRFETPETNGIGRFTTSMLTRGTTTRTMEELVDELEGMAGGVRGFSGRNSAGVSANFLSRFFNRGIEIMADVLLDPVVPEKELAIRRRDILASIKSREDNLSRFAFKLLQETLYKEHPYGMPVEGEKETVSAMTREDLLAHYRRVFVPERMVLAVVGDIQTEQAIEKVTELFGGFERKAGPLPELPVETRQTAIRTTGKVKDKAQTNIALGFLATTITGEDRHAMSILSEVLSSMGGRLFVELRDRQSLAYAVSAFSNPGVEPGLFGAYIGCAPEKKRAAIEGILKELEKVVTEPVTEEEINRAKRALIGGYEIGLQSASSQASDIANNELFGLGYNYFRRYPALIEAVTAEDILEAAKKYITLDAYTISIVGPEGPND